MLDSCIRWSFPKWVLALEPEKRCLVLAHEREHIRSGNPAILLLGLLCLAAMPWNVPLWWKIRRLRDAIESDCDEHVIRRCSVRRVGTPASS